MKKLVLFIIPLFGLFFTSNSFALQHDYSSFLTADYLITPPFVSDPSNSASYFDFSSTEFGSDVDQFEIFTPLILTVPSSDTSTFEPYSGQFTSHLAFKYDQFSYNNSLCVGSPFQYSNFGFGYSFLGDWYHSGHSVFISTRAIPVQGGYQPFNPCFSMPNELNYHLDNFDSNRKFLRDWNLNINSIDTVFSPVSNSISSHNGVSLSQDSVYSSGVHYTSSFSFSKLFANNNVPLVRSLTIPLSDLDGYFLKYQNLYSGRQFEWHFGFRFDDLIFPDDMSNTYARIRLSGLKRSDSFSSNGTTLNFNCTMETTTSSSESGSIKTNVDFTCPVVLDADYAGFSLVQFELGNSNDDFLFKTSNSWSFSAVYLVSDSDYTPGDSFNSSINGDIWGPANGVPTGESDIAWVDSLVKMFSFGIDSNNTPLGLLFGGFYNNSCASIPTIAGMIHSEETQVCPWFSAETRAITTPVLTLFSGFLIFGFIIRWLGSSSGNFIEDSSTHEVGNLTIKKRGK